MGQNISELVAPVSGGIVIPSSQSVLEILAKRKEEGKYQGARTVSAKMLNFLEEEDIGKLVEQSLEPLKDDYFERLAQTKSKVLIEVNNQGIVILDGNYMDIMAVNPEKRRNGVGSGLMYDTIKLMGELYWRSQPKRDAANRFYTSLMPNPNTFKPAEFTSDDGIKYFGYAIGLSPAEFQKAQQFMQQKPKNYR